jgi:hypothetical protein
MTKKNWCFPPREKTDRAGADGGLARRNGHKAMRRRLLAMVCLAGSAAAVASDSPAYFAKPYSGEKVTAYTVELPVGQTEKQSFQIPGQCREAMEHLSAGALKWGSQLERRLWHKVGNDCAYHAFLNRFPRSVEHDHISGFDFRNAPLQELLPNPCRVTSGAPDGPCGPGVNGRAAIFGFIDVVDDPSVTEEFDAASCRIVGGAFRGQVAAGSDGLRCRQDRRGSGFRVMSVNHGDVNGDGYLDAVLRIVPLGPATSRMPVVLAYTRLSPDGDLRVPVAGASGR